MYLKCLYLGNCLLYNVQCTVLQDQIIKTKTKTTGSKQRHLEDLTFE